MPSKPRKTTAPKSTTKKAASARAKPPADPTLKKRWEAAIERYRQSKTQELAGWDERYEALGEIIEEELFVAAGFKTVRDFLKVEVPDQDERSVRRSIRVARYFDPEDEARYGITKLDLALDYLEAAGGAPLAPAKIRLDRLSIVVPRRGRDLKKPFAEATAQELAAAARAARAKNDRGPKPNTSPVVASVRALLSKAKLGAVAVSLRGMRLAFTNVDPAALTRFGTALTVWKAPREDE